MVLVVKKNRKLKVCVDLRNLNSATPKDKYLMSIAYMLINKETRHRYLLFIDRYLDYNQILITEKDMVKSIQVSKSNEDLCVSDVP